MTIPVALAVLSGCGEDPVGPRSVPCDPLLLSYTTASGDTVTTTKGVKYIDLKAGDGLAATTGSEIGVNYSLYEISGDLIESSCDPNTVAFELMLGDPRGAIEGFQIGTMGIEPGGVRRIILPVELGYQTGELAGLQLVFDVEFEYYK